MSKIEKLLPNKREITKSDIVGFMENIITDMPKAVVAAGSKEIFNILEDNLVLGYRIEIRGFGSWSIRYLPPRNAHNPRSGEKVTTLGKFRPHFKAGAGLKARINKLSEKDQFNTVEAIKTQIAEEETA